MTRSRMAFTVPELMLSISLMTVIGVAVATLESALSNAYGQTDALESAIQSRRSAMMNIETELRKAKLVVSHSDSALAIWTGDDNGDGLINANEIMLFQGAGAAEGKISRRRVRFPESMSEDTVLALNINKNLQSLSTTDGVRIALTSPTLTTYNLNGVLATAVQELTFTTDVAPPLTELVLIKMVVGSAPDSQITLTSSVRLRASAVEYLERYAGVWVVNAPSDDDDDGEAYEFDDIDLRDLIENGAGGDDD